MELDQHLLTQQFRLIEKDLMILKIIDIFYLEGRHTDLPDHFARGRAEGHIMRGDDRIGHKGVDLLLGQLLMSEIEIVLINETPVEILFLPVEGVVMVIGQDPVLEVLFHSTNCDIRFYWYTQWYLNVNVNVRSGQKYRFFSLHNLYKAF